MWMVTIYVYNIKNQQHMYFHREKFIIENKILRGTQFKIEITVKSENKLKDLLSS